LGLVSPCAAQEDLRLYLPCVCLGLPATNKGERGTGRVRLSVTSKHGPAPTVGAGIDQPPGHIENRPPAVSPERGAVNLDEICWSSQRHGWTGLEHSGRRCSTTNHITPPASMFRAMDPRRPVLPQTSTEGKKRAASTSGGRSVGGLDLLTQRSSRRRESNPRPELYKSPALPLSYSGAYRPAHRCLVCNQSSFLVIPGSSRHAYRSLPCDRIVTRQLLCP
jgi:hypothetical protein